MNLILLGPFIGGISLFIGAVTAIVTLIIVQRRKVEDDWIDRFRIIYGEFWDDDEMAEVRKWVLNQTIYAETAASAFAYRNSLAVDNCDVPREDHDKLEKFDRFCAFMIRIKSFPQHRMGEYRRSNLWQSLLAGNYWISRIKKRAEMEQYVKNHWPELFEP